MTKRRIVSFVLLVIWLPLFPAAAQDSAAQAKAATAKMARLLDESGLSFSKFQDNVWSVTYKGKVLTEFPVLITSQPDLAVIFTVVAEKKEFKVTPEMMRAMLKMANDRDRAKVIFDDAGDVIVRIDVSLRTLDKDELVANVDQVAAVTDATYEAIKPFIIGAKK